MGRIAERGNPSPVLATLVALSFFHTPSSWSADCFQSLVVCGEGALRRMGVRCEGLPLRRRLVWLLLSLVALGRRTPRFGGPRDDLSAWGNLEAFFEFAGGFLRRHGPPVGRGLNITQRCLAEQA